MSTQINRSDVLIDFKDVYGKTITDDVEIKIYNSQLMSLKQIFDVKFRGAPEMLPGIPAFPIGHAQMIVKPTKYRFKQRFINIQSGMVNRITEYFFVDPDHADPHPIQFVDLADKTYGTVLLQVLNASQIDQTRWDVWRNRSEPAS